MIQVHIDDRFEVNGLAIHIYERVSDNQVRVLRANNGFPIWDTMDVHVGSHMPTFGITIPREAAGSLYAALGKLLGSVENPEMLRKDYEAERRRVDRLIEAVIER